MILLVINGEKCQPMKEAVRRKKAGRRMASLCLQWYCSGGASIEGGMGGLANISLCYLGNMYIISGAAIGKSLAICIFRCIHLLLLLLS